MKTGMLWFDNDPKADMPTKILRAVEYYSRKYGQKPDLCYVHPTMISTTTHTQGVDVRPNRQVLPNHFWIGVHELVTLAG